MARKKVEPNQTPRQRFIRLGNARVNLILKKFNILVNLADRRRYEFSEKDIDLMEDVLKEKLSYSIKKFREYDNKKNNIEFTF